MKKEVKRVKKENQKEGVKGGQKEGVKEEGGGVKKSQR
mgnify:CR=1 FL=1